MERRGPTPATHVQTHRPLRPRCSRGRAGTGSADGAWTRALASARRARPGVEGLDTQGARSGGRLFLSSIALGVKTLAASL